MNFRLVLALSCFGLLFGIAAVAGVIHAGTELLVWCGVWIVCALVIGARAPGKFFLHGFLVGLLAGVIAPIIQVAMFDSYVAHNPKVVESFKALPPAWSPRIVVLAATPVIGLLYGIVLGGLAWVAGKVMRRGGGNSATAA